MYSQNINFNKHPIKNNFIDANMQNNSHLPPYLHQEYVKGIKMPLNSNSSMKYIPDVVSKIRNKDIAKGFRRLIKDRGASVLDEIEIGEYEKRLIRYGRKNPSDREAEKIEDVLLRYGIDVSIPRIIYQNYQAICNCGASRSKRNEANKNIKRFLNSISQKEELSDAYLSAAAGGKFIYDDKAEVPIALLLTELLIFSGFISALVHIRADPVPLPDYFGGKCRTLCSINGTQNNTSVDDILRVEIEPCSEIMAKQCANLDKTNKILDVTGFDTSNISNFSSKFSGKYGSVFFKKNGRDFKAESHSRDVSDVLILNKNGTKEIEEEWERWNKANFYKFLKICLGYEFFYFGIPSAIYGWFKTGKKCCKNMKRDKNLNERSYSYKKAKNKLDSARQSNDRAEMTKQYRNILIHSDKRYLPEILDVSEECMKDGKEFGIISLSYLKKSVGISTEKDELKKCEKLVNYALENKDLSEIKANVLKLKNEIKKKIVRVSI